MKFGVWGLDGGLFSQLAAFLIKTGPFRTGPRPRTRIKGLIECFKLVTQTLLCEAALPVVPWGISQQHQHPLGRKRGKSLQEHMCVTFFKRKGERITMKQSHAHTWPSCSLQRHAKKDGNGSTVLPELCSLYSTTRRDLSSKAAQCPSRWGRCGILVPSGPI